jgi:hypothetical protein
MNIYTTYSLEYVLTGTYLLDCTEGLLTGEVAYVNYELHSAAFHKSIT